MSYDRWLQAPYMREQRCPFRCTECREYFFDVDDHEESEPHCYAEEDGSVIGTLEIDDSYVDEPDPDEAYDHMRERNDW